MPQPKIIASPQIGQPMMARRLLGAAGCGVLLALAFPDAGLWPAAVIALAGLNLLMIDRSPREGAWLGLAFGMAFFLPTLHWSGVYVGVLPWVALALLQSAFFAALGALLPRVWTAPGAIPGYVLAVAGLWVAQEALRSRIPFGGFPWARVAFSQANSPLLGWASLGGAPLVTAVVAGLGALLAVAVRYRHRLWLGTWTWMAISTVALVIGPAVLPPLGTSSQESIRVAAVQGNVPEPGLEFNAERRAVLDNHARETSLVASRATSVIDLVVWPENSSDIDPLKNEDAAAVIDTASQAVDAPILVGAVLQGSDGHPRNASILWGAADSARPGPGRTYLKRHLAPFGEYIPLRPFFRLFSDKVDLVRSDFRAGDQVGVMSVPLRGDFQHQQTSRTAKIAPVICFEVAYDGIIRDGIRAGAQVLVVQTNNATFGYTAESTQQLAMSRLRAVETGRAVVHVSTVGVSALIRPDGSMISYSTLFTPDALTGTLPLVKGYTLASVLGWFPELGLALAGLLLWFRAQGLGSSIVPADPSSAASPGPDPHGDPELDPLEV